MHSTQNLICFVCKVWDGVEYGAVNKCRYTQCNLRSVYWITDKPNAGGCARFPRPTWNKSASANVRRNYYILWNIILGLLSFRGTEQQRPCIKWVRRLFKLPSSNYINNRISWRGTALNTSANQFPGQSSVAGHSWRRNTHRRTWSKLETWPNFFLKAGRWQVTCHFGQFAGDSVIEDEQWNPKILKQVQ